MANTTGWSAAADATIKDKIAEARERHADPDTTLEGAPFVSETDLDALAEAFGDEIVDVFAVVAEYDHEVGKQTAPEYDSYEEAREAGVTLLATNGNVLSFRIDKRTTRKA